MTPEQPYDLELLTLLEPRTYERELYGFRGGRFNSDRTKFFAYTYGRFDSAEFDDYHWVFLNFGGHSSMGTDTTREQKWIDDHSYHMKGMEECIKEGIYEAWSINFTGMLYEEKWFLSKGLTFWGEQMDEEKSISWLTRGWSDPEFWSKGSFGPPMALNGLNGQPVRNIEEEEFSPAPWLVTSIKRDEKEKINQAFEQYMNVAYIDPFLQRMRIHSPEEYVDFSPIFGNYTLLYPRERSHFLLVAISKHREKGYRLVWFFYEPASSTFYRWTYPQIRYSKGYYFDGEDLIVVLKDISEWNDGRFLNSSRTLDDPNFWAEYVLKKEAGQYLWLEAVG
jgi:hypothetical protein